jgi:hypothetical protein
MNIVLLKTYSGNDMIAEALSGNEEHFLLRGIHYVNLQQDREGRMLLNLIPFWIFAKDIRNLETEFPRSLVAHNTQQIPDDIRAAYVKVMGRIVLPPIDIRR